MTIRKPVRDDAPEISVVVPTLPSREISSLKYLKDQESVRYEVVIVDDNSLDICQARNAGIESSNSDFIALTDDDSRPPPQWLRTAKDALAPINIKLIEGPILEWDEPRRIYHGVNIAFTRDAWSSVDGFDSRYAGWMDDCVFGWEIEKTLGEKATSFVEDMTMSHPGPKGATPIEANERLARREYPERYFTLMRRPSSLKGKLLIGIASKTYRFVPGIWDLVL